MTRKITDTATAEAHPEWLGGADPRAIARQESRGQVELVASSQLPTEGLGEVAEALGIEVLGASEGDELFSDVKLPEGWQKRSTDHAMWSDLVDADGVKRASIFYKAAFYDRRAFIRFARDAG